MRTLWHYTCDHRAPMLQADGFVRPVTQLVKDTVVPPWGELAWFTDLDAPVRDALVLTSDTLDCDRTTNRFRVLDDSTIWPWVTAPGHRTDWGRYLELADGARPMHWFVSSEPVPVAYDPRGQP